MKHDIMLLLTVIILAILSLTAILVLCSYNCACEGSRHTYYYSPTYVLQGHTSEEIPDLDALGLTVSEDEIEMLACVIQKEVGYCSYASKLAVARTIVNRVLHDDFPDTIEDVLHQENQFTTIRNYYDRSIAPDDETYQAIDQVLSGAESHEAIYFYAPQYVYDTSIINWFENDLVFQFELEGVRYFK